MSLPARIPAHILPDFQTLLSAVVQTSCVLLVVSVHTDLPVLQQPADGCRVGL